MPDETLDLPFRGSRSYLHSTSVFDALLPRDPQPRDIELSFSKQTDRRVVLAASKREDDDGLVARYRSAGLELFLYETAEPMTRREPYDEEGVVARAGLDAEGAFSLPVAEATLIEALVASYKHLLMTRGLNRGQKLFFTRLKLSHIPSSGRVRIAHKRVVGRFFQARLGLDGAPLGELFFAIEDGA